MLWSDIDSARIIGIGEATHGSKEFHLLRSRFIDALSKSNDLIVFFEAGICEIENINKWIQTGEGDIDTLTASLKYWPWRTIETRDLFLAIRNNVMLGRKILLIGMEYDHSGSIKAISNHVKSNETLRDKWLEYAENLNATLKTAEFNSDSLKHLVNELRMMHPDDPMFHYLLSTFQDHAREFIKSETTVGFRDSIMAQTFSYFYALHGKPKSIIVAHNGHIMRYKNALGEYLKEAHGSDYYALGTGFKEGSFLAINDFTMNTDSFYVRTKTLSETCGEWSFFPMNTNKQKIRIFQVGSNYSDRLYKEYTYSYRNAERLLDGYIIMDSISSAQILPGSRDDVFSIQFLFPKTVDYKVKFTDIQTNGDLTVHLMNKKLLKPGKAEIASGIIIPGDTTLVLSGDARGDIHNLYFYGSGQASGSVQFNSSLKQVFAKYFDVSEGQWKSGISGSYQWEVFWEGERISFLVNSIIKD